MLKIDENIKYDVFGDCKYDYLFVMVTLCVKNDNWSIYGHYHFFVIYYIDRGKTYDKKRFFIRFYC